MKNNMDCRQRFIQQLRIILLHLVGACLSLIAVTASALPGDFDHSFGAGGVIIGTTKSFMTMIGVTFDNQDRVLVSGYDPSGHITVARFSSQGQLDTTFGSAGRYVSSINYGAVDWIRYVTKVDSLGRILLAAPIRREADSNNSSKATAFGVFRLLSNGQPDSSFGQNGFVRYGDPPSEYVFQGMVLDANDRIVLAGWKMATSTVGEKPVIVRLSANGTVDTSFGQQGAILEPPAGFPAAVNVSSMAMDASQRILVSFELGNLLRFNENGELDTAFSAATRPRNQGDFATRFAAAILPAADGNIFFLRRGWAGRDSPISLRITKLLDSGELDPAFGQAGELSTPATEAYAASIDAALDSEGRLVLLARSMKSSLSNTDVAILRYFADGSRDSDFGAAGIRTIDLSDGEYPTTVKIDQQGKIVTLGLTAGIQTGDRYFIARLMGDDSGQETPGTTPDFFQFSPYNDAPPGLTLTSAAAVLGLNAPSPITVQNGQYCTSQSDTCGCEITPFTSAPSTIRSGQYVCARHQSSASSLGTVTTTVAVGGVSADFKSTTSQIAAPTVSLGTDSWFNTYESGWGMVFRQTGSLLLGAWYTYDLQGKPVWYTVQCVLNGSYCSGDLYLTSGPPFGPTFNPGAVSRTYAGRLSLGFSNNDTASISYSVASVSKLTGISRQKQLTGQAIGQDYSDIWWNSAESGWGATLTHRQNSIFVAWYTYGASGQPVWYTALCQMQAGVCTGQLLATTGPSFSAPFDPAQVVRTTVGSITLTFTGPAQATMAYDLGGQSYSKAISRF